MRFHRGPTNGGRNGKPLPQAGSQAFGFVPESNSAIRFVALNYHKSENRPYFGAKADSILRHEFLALECGRDTRDQGFRAIIYGEFRLLSEYLFERGRGVFLEILYLLPAIRLRRTIVSGIVTAFR